MHNPPPPTMSYPLFSRMYPHPHPTICLTCSLADCSPSPLHPNNYLTCSLAECTAPPPPHLSILPELWQNAPPLPHPTIYLTWSLAECTHPHPPSQHLSYLSFGRMHPPPPPPHPNICLTWALAECTHPHPPIPTSILPALWQNAQQCWPSSLPVTRKTENGWQSTHIQNKKLPLSVSSFLSKPLVTSKMDQGWRNWHKEAVMNSSHRC